MYEFKCKIADLSRDFKTGKAKITLIADGSILKAVEELGEKDLNCVLKPYRKKRSLTANGYFWELVDKLAAKMNISKEEIYRGYVRNIGGNNTTVCVKQEKVDDFIRDWSHNGLGWVTEIDESKLKGCINITCYSGSSTYDTDQMHRLIGLAKQDCEAVGVETLTPEEISKLIKEWGKINEK